MGKGTKWGVLALAVLLLGMGTVMFRRIQAQRTKDATSKQEALEAVKNLTSPDAEPGQSAGTSKLLAQLDQKGSTPEKKPTSEKKPAASSTPKSTSSTTPKSSSSSSSSSSSRYASDYQSSSGSNSTASSSSGFYESSGSQSSTRLTLRDGEGSASSSSSSSAGSRYASDAVDPLTAARDQAMASGSEAINSAARYAEDTVNSGYSSASRYASDAAAAGSAAVANGAQEAASAVNEAVSPSNSASFGYYGDSTENATASSRAASPSAAASSNPATPSASSSAMPAASATAGSNAGAYGSYGSYDQAATEYRQPAASSDQGYQTPSGSYSSGNSGNVASSEAAYPSANATADSSYSSSSASVRSATPQSSMPNANGGYSSNRASNYPTSNYPTAAESGSYAETSPSDSQYERAPESYGGSNSFADSTGRFREPRRMNTNYDSNVTPAVDQSPAGDLYRQASAPKTTLEEMPSGNAAVGGKYVVEPNDSYWIISKKVYQSGAYFKAIYEHNREKFPDPAKLQVGDELLVPDVEKLREYYPELCPKLRSQTPGSPQTSAVAARNYGGGRRYVVEAGDTLFDIARYELGKAELWATIYRMNRDVLTDDLNYLRPGTVLYLPDNGGAPQEDIRPDSVTRRPGSSVQR